MAFVDGEPIDAAKLGQLETDLNILKATIPQIGVSTTTIVGSSGSSVGSSTAAPIVQSRILARNDMTKCYVAPGKDNKTTINFPGDGFSAQPVIVISTRWPAGFGSAFTAKGLDLPTAVVVTSSITTKGFDVMIPASKSSPTGAYCYVSYIAITGS
jgi:hypothetical protein